MILTDCITPITLTIKSTVTFIDANYVRINTTPLRLPCSIMRFINPGDIDLIISFDGIHEHIFLRAGTIYQFSTQTNNMVPSSIALIPKGTIFWAKTVNQAHVPNSFILIAGYSPYRS